MIEIIRAVIALTLSIAATVSATQPAARVAETVGPPAPTDPPTSQVDGRCAGWADLAFAVGWDAAEWPTIDRVMFCESRCDPDAHNPSGATGLMQVMPMHAHGRDLYDPATNLAVALEVRRAQGWRASGTRKP